MPRTLDTEVIETVRLRQDTKSLELTVNVEDNSRGQIKATVQVSIKCSVYQVDAQSTLSFIVRLNPLN